MFSGESRRIPDAAAGERESSHQVTQGRPGTRADYLHLHLPHPAEGGGVYCAASLSQFCTAFVLGLGTSSGKGYGWGRRAGVGLHGACLEVPWGWPVEIGIGLGAKS